MDIVDSINIGANAPTLFLLDPVDFFIVIYAEIFNDLDQIKIGNEMYLVDTDDKRTRYTYIVTEYKTVEPSDTWVLNDFNDDRLTVISCTDDGEYRQVVVGILK